MTREMAIEILMGNRDVFKSINFGSTYSINTALDMAIEALGQKCCDDCISRAKTCDYIAEFVNHEYSTQSECKMVNVMIEGIQHLPSVKQEPCKDCISREEAIETVKGMCGVISPWSDDVILISKYGAIAELNMLEPVTPKPKTGHWIKHEHNGIGHIECSECLCWFLEAHLLHNSYCPNCGAKMESEEVL